MTPLFLNFPTNPPPSDHYDQFEIDHLGSTTPSTTTIDSDPSMVKKLNHNASERDRRKKINDLYSSLRALLPLSDQTKKMSIPATVSRVLKYVPLLQEEVEGLVRKRDELLSRIQSKQQGNYTKNSIEKPSLCSIESAIPTKPASQQRSPNPISNPAKQDANSKLDIASPIAQREPQTPAKKMEVADQRSFGLSPVTNMDLSKDVGANGKEARRWTIWAMSVGDEVRGGRISIGVSVRVSSGVDGPWEGRDGGRCFVILEVVRAQEVIRFQKQREGEEEERDVRLGCFG
uniref:BHLH domain-containing protein n=1 Tax=Cannabis sativa TaxID=3483 RepID=A0A803QPJ0_CANSA